MEKNVNINSRPEFKGYSLGAVVDPYNGDIELEQWVRTIIEGHRDELDEEERKQYLEDNLDLYVVRTNRIAFDLKPREFNPYQPLKDYARSDEKFLRLMKLDFVLLPEYFSLSRSWINERTKVFLFERPKMSEKIELTEKGGRRLNKVAEYERYFYGDPSSDGSGRY